MGHLSLNNAALRWRLLHDLLHMVMVHTQYRVNVPTALPLFLVLTVVAAAAGQGGCEEARPGFAVVTRTADYVLKMSSRNTSFSVNR